MTSLPLVSWISRGFTIYFSTEAERTKFLANTAVALRMLAVGPLIASTYYHTVDVNIYEAHYTAFLFGDDSGLLAAKASFTGYYSASGFQGDSDRRYQHRHGLLMTPKEIMRMDLFPTDAVAPMRGRRW